MENGQVRIHKSKGIGVRIEQMFKYEWLKPSDYGSFSKFKKKIYHIND
jgi:hypothetical protein